MSVRKKGVPYFKGAKAVHLKVFITRGKNFVTLHGDR